MIVAIIFVTTSQERLSRGLKTTNCAVPAVKTRNNHYENTPIRSVVGGTLPLGVGLDGEPLESGSELLGLFGERSDGRGDLRRRGGLFLRRGRGGLGPVGGRLADPFDVVDHRHHLLGAGRLVAHRLADLLDAVEGYLEGDLSNVAVVSQPFAGREVFIDYAEEEFGAATGRVRLTRDEFERVAEPVQATA